jgi:hypothetical protein
MLPRQTEDLENPDAEDFKFIPFIPVSSSKP